MTWAWGEVLGGATVTRAPRGWGSAGTAFQEGFLEVVLALRLHDGDDRVPWEAPEGSHADHMWPSWVHRASVNFHASAPRGAGAGRGHSFPGGVCLTSAAHLGSCDALSVLRHTTQLLLLLSNGILKHFCAYLTST